MGHLHFETMQRKLGGIRFLVLVGLLVLAVQGLGAYAEGTEDIQYLLDELDVYFADRDQVTIDAGCQMFQKAIAAIPEGDSRSISLEFRMAHLLISPPSPQQGRDRKKDIENGITILTSLAPTHNLPPNDYWSLEAMYLKGVGLGMLNKWEETEATLFEVVKVLESQEVLNYPENCAYQQEGYYWAMKANAIGGMIGAAANLREMDLDASLNVLYPMLKKYEAYPSIVEAVNCQIEQYTAIKNKEMLNAE